MVWCLESHKGLKQLFVLYIIICKFRDRKNFLFKEKKWIYTEKKYWCLVDGVWLEKP